MIDRQPSNTAFAVVRHGEAAQPTQAEIRRVRDLFAPSFDDLRVDVHALSATVSFVWLSESGVDAVGQPVVWGTCIGRRGTATDAEVSAVIDSPGLARDLLGRFGIAAPTDDGVLLISGAELSHVFKIVRGARRDVVATSGTLAALLSGDSVAIDAERIAEYLAFDCVLSDAELIAGVELVPEASVARLSSAGISVSTYWSADERFAERAEPKPLDLWERLRENAARVFAAHDSWLGLTSGRDSTLIASALAAESGRTTCFTFGDPDYWDVHGAKALSDAMGWDHRRVWRFKPVPINLGKLSQLAPWTDGLETARNLYAAPWDAPFKDQTFVSGHGGEIGRAFYWKNSTDLDATMQRLIAGPADQVPEPWRSVCAERIAAELGKYEHRGTATALDLFYALNRTRAWTGRGVRRPQFGGSVMSYGDPATVQLLLNIPVDKRRDASFFDETIALDERNLRAIALDGAAASWQRAIATPKKASRLTALRDSAMRDPLRLATQSLAGGSLVAETYGRKWWITLVRSAARASNTEARRRLWNALAVDGLHRALR